MSLSKAGIRDQIRQMRSTMTPETVAEQSREITRSVLQVLNGHNPVMVYASKFPEVDTHPLIRILIDQGRDVIVPIIERETRSLRLSYLSDPSHLVPST